MELYKLGILEIIPRELEKTITDFAKENAIAVRAFRNFQKDIKNENSHLRKVISLATKEIELAQKASKPFIEMPTYSSTKEKIKESIAKDVICYPALHPPKNDKVENKIEAIIDEKLEGFASDLLVKIEKSVIKKKSKKTSKQKTIFISLQDQEIYKKPRTRYRYSILRQRYKIIKAMERKYTPTKELAEIVESVSADSIRNAIQKINRRFKNKLKIKKPLIKGKSGAGYRLNPDLKIRKKWK